MTAVAEEDGQAGAAPRDAGGWAALADRQERAGQAGEALGSWSRAVELAPGDAALVWRRAKALQAIGRAEEGRVWLRRAAVLAPERFEPLFDLARAAKDAGDAAEAEAVCAQLLARYPGSPAVAWLDARLALDRGDGTGALERLPAELVARCPNPQQRAELLLLRGEAFDALARPAEAFAAAAAGKALQRAAFAGRAAEREPEVERLRRLAAWFAKADASPWRAPPPDGAPGPARAHVFLVGFPRSGTTLLEQALAGHPDVVALEEAATFAPHYAAFLADAPGFERLAALSPEEAEHWRARYWDEVRAAGADPRGKVFVDKAPAGTLYLPLVARLFPKAKVLFAQRDPRDVVLSCFRHNFQMNAMTYAFTDLAETAACYDACMALDRIYRLLLPVDRRDVRHEALVADFAGELGGVLDFLGLKAGATETDVGAVARRRTVRTPSASQVRAGLNARGVGRWRAYAEALAPVLPVLEPWVEALGYPPFSTV